MSYRKEIEELIYATVDDILPDGKNKEIYKKLFSNMGDKEFDAFMEKLISSKGTLHLVCPANSEKKLSVTRNIKIAKTRFNYDFFQSIKMTDKETGVAYETPKKYIMLHLPVRRAIQTLQNKASIPKNQFSVDQRTEQATGASKGSRLSMPEIQILKAQEMDDSIIELIKHRGGDTKAFHAFNQSIVKTGGVSQKTLNSLNTRPKATEVLGIFFKAMHINNNI